MDDQFYNQPTPLLNNETTITYSTPSNHINGQNWNLFEGELDKLKIVQWTNSIKYMDKQGLGWISSSPDDLHTDLCDFIHFLFYRKLISQLDRIKSIDLVEIDQFVKRIKFYEYFIDWIKQVSIIYFQLDKNCNNNNDNIII